MKTTYRLLLKAGWVLLFPLLNFTTRYTLHSIFGLRIGWGRAFVDVNLIVPIIPAFLIYFVSAGLAIPVKLKLRPLALLLNGALFVSFLALKLFLPRFCRARGFSGVRMVGIGIGNVSIGLFPLDWPEFLFHKFQSRRFISLHFPGAFHRDD